MHCRVFSSSPGLFPPDVSSTIPPVWQPKMSSDTAKCTCRANSPPSKSHSSKPVVLELACRLESPRELQNSWCLCPTRQIAVYWTWNVAWFLKCLKASPGCSKVQTSLAASSLSSNSGPISFSLFFNFQEAARPNTPSCLRLTRHLVLGKEGRFPGFSSHREASLELARILQ